MLNLEFNQEALKALSAYFFDDYRFKKQSLLFKRLLYCFVLLKCTYWLMHFGLLFGAQSIVYPVQIPAGPVKGLVFILTNSTSPGLSLFFILFLSLISILSLFFKRMYFFADLIAWLIVLNVHNKIYQTLSGGDSLLNQFMFFNIVLTQQFHKPTNLTGQLKVLMHNLGVWGIMVQLCLVYFISALAKLADAQWLSGTAVATIAQIRHFSLNGFPAGLLKAGWLSTTLNYAVLFYQAGFVILVWIKPCKKPLLLFGILMHLYIGIVMGLPMFALIMILSYVYFWPLKETEI